MKKIILIFSLSIFALSAFEPLYARDGGKSEAHHERSYTYDPNKHININQENP
ncbi:MAG: hypothetical protein K2X28_03465 [Alphaproteobacteria bacterium]|nr:hypothetical protein [Alphaproteobacteria bacterium]